MHEGMKAGDYVKCANVIRNQEHLTLSYLLFQSNLARPIKDTVFFFLFSTFPF